MNSNNNSNLAKYVPRRGWAGTKRGRAQISVAPTPPPTRPSAPKKSKQLPLLRKPFVKKSLNDIGKYIEFIEKQVADKVRNNANLKSLKCRIDNDGIITYRKSDFDKGTLKDIYKDYAKPMLVTPDTVGTLTTGPSLLPCFDDTTNRVHFWPNALVFAHAEEILKFFPFFLGVENASLASVKFMTTLFAGEYDNGLKGLFVQDFIEENITNMYSDTFRALFAKADEKPVCISAFEKGPPSTFHGVACVLHKEGDGYIFGVFDPNFFTRPDKLYISGAISVYLVVKLVAAALGKEVKVVNLSSHCIETAKGTHCAQYQIDAEYCLFYSLYFLYLYAKSGGKEDMRSLVEKTYIVSPAELRREPCAANKRFRLVMMSFILTCWTLTIESLKYKGNIKTIYDQVLGEDGFALLHPDVLVLLNEVRGGGRRRVTRKNKH